MPQLRQNIVTGEWVVIAPERAKRPDDFISADTVRHQSRTKCPFCKDKEEYKNRIKKYDTASTWLIPNKFPAFIGDPKNCSTRSYKVENDFYRARNSIGGHDVIVIKDHDTDIPRFSKKAWYDLFYTFKKRYKYYDEVEKNAYTMGIYNHGSSAGASIEHPHAQIFSSNIIPNIISREITHTQKYFDNNGECIFCKIIEHEKKEKVRVLYEDDAYIAFTVYAARFPFEIWIYPKEHRSRFEDIPNSDIQKLTSCLVNIFHKLDTTLNDPPLNFFIHSIPNTIEETAYYHWHIEIAPRLAKYGGYEMGSGNIIDVVSPEKAAEYLKKTNEKK